MPSARAVITLEPEEQRRLIEDQRVVAVASLGPRGWPHVMPLWSGPREGEIWIYPYAKSQEVRNLARDPRATRLIETGRAHTQLRRAQIEGGAAEGSGSTSRRRRATRPRPRPAMAPASAARSPTSPRPSRSGSRTRC